MNNTIKELFERKSVRAFENKPVENDKKQLIIDAAIQAPTAGNMTLYSIIDVRNQEIKDKLAQSCDNQPFIAQAPLVLVFCADYQKWYDLFCATEEAVRKPGLGDFMLASDDALIAAQNAVCAAWSLGIGSCYIGDIMEEYETHRKLFNLPRYVMPVAMVVFGYPTKQQQERPKPRRQDRRSVVMENIYEKMTPEEFAKVLQNQQGKEGEDFDRWLSAFCKRKWNSDFSCEMSRSVKVMMESWLGATIQEED